MHRNQENTAAASTNPNAHRPPAERLATKPTGWIVTGARAESRRRETAARTDPTWRHAPAVLGPTEARSSARHVAFVSSSCSSEQLSGVTFDLPAYRAAFCASVIERRCRVD